MYDEVYEDGEQPERKDNPFFLTDEEKRRIFYCLFSFRSSKQHEIHHLPALQTGDLGKYLFRFASDCGIKFKQENIPQPNMMAYYAPALLGTGRIAYREEGANAAVLGHEIRHAWQHLALPWDIIQPRAPQEKAILDTFIEADARAIEFGVCLQAIYGLRTNNDYSRILIHGMDTRQKQICEYNPDKVIEICESPVKFKQALRMEFNSWIATSPAQPIYETNKANILAAAPTTRMGKLFYSLPLFRGLNARPAFNRAQMDPEYPARLATYLGLMCGPGSGNYLTETEGPALNSSFYTNLNNYRVEREVSRLQKTLTPT